MTVWIGNDHGGYEMKRRIVSELENLDAEVRDVGSGTAEIVRYPYYANEVAAAVSIGEADRGVLICSTGIGMSIAANKYPGVRAALVNSSYMAKMTRAHNDSNVLCLGGQTQGIAEVVDIVKTWMSTSYDGGRHDISLRLLAESEHAMLTGDVWKPTGPRL